VNFKTKQLNRQRRHSRVRALVKGTSERPRISVFKSNKHIFTQFIDDETGKTILSSKVVADKKSKIGRGEGPVRSPRGTRAEPGLGSRVSVGTKTDKATKIGEMLAEKAKESGIKEAVFDRGGFKFHGRIKAVADGLRKGGIKF